MTTKRLEVKRLSSQATWWQTIFAVLDHIQDANIDYTLTHEAAIVAQGVAAGTQSTVEISIQWDLFTHAYTLFQFMHPEPKVEQTDSAQFSFFYQDITFIIRCYYNTVVVTDPDRLSVLHNQRQIWVKALDYYLQVYTADDPRRRAIKAYLSRLQQQNSHLNADAWNQDTYTAWIHRHGTPQEVAENIRKAPRKRLGTLNRYLHDLTDKKVMNLLGSHGSKAIAMALLGAHVTIADISPENARYAREVAQAAGIPLRYLVTDVLQLPEEERNHSYDLVFMEMGILHYFIDLEPLVQLVTQLLRPQGHLILQDFHPLSTKLITAKGKKQRVDGNYFDKTLTVSTVAFSKHLPVNEQTATRQVYLRKWTLGEIITAFAATELIIRRLDEEPNSKIDDIGIPKTFTLVAEKSSPH